MNTTSLATALSVLRDTVTNHRRSVDGALRRDIGTLCTELFTALTSTLDQIDDPRSVLHTLELIEEHYRYTTGCSINQRIWRVPPKLDESL